MCLSMFSTELHAQSKLSNKICPKFCSIILLHFSRLSWNSLKGALLVGPIANWSSNEVDTFPLLPVDSASKFC